VLRINACIEIGQRQSIDHRPASMP